MRRIIPALAICALLPSVLVAEGGQEQSDNTSVVHVYSHRHYEADRQLYEQFTEATGIDVQVVEAGADELIQRLAAEGEASLADVLITVDAGRLYRAQQMDLLQPVESSVLSTNIPAKLRQEEGYWFGLTKRARVVAYHEDRVSRDELSTYQDLASPKWRDRIAVRSSSNIYNISLLSSAVAHYGEDAAREWAGGIVENMARRPQGNDRDQLRAVAAGVADIAIVNTYYIALMRNSDDPDERSVGESVRVFFPNQETTGAHVNISGAGVTASADNSAGAVRLIEFLTSADAQEVFAQANYEYPVRDDVSPAESVAEFGSFTEDSLPLSELGANSRQATRIFDEVGWE
jgi:iron(III) transport system substrate-binding protein